MTWISKQIQPVNHKGQKHGYWQSTFIDDDTGYKTYYINGIPFGLDDIRW